MSIDYLDIKKLADELDELRDRHETAEADMVDGDYAEDSNPLDEDEAARLADLLKLEKELGDLHVFSRNESTAIPDCDFKEYAQDLHEDMNGRDAVRGWPYDYIDWDRAAEALQSDYTAFDFDGTSYWVRA